MRASNLSLIFIFSLIIMALTLSPSHAQDPEDWEERDATLVGRISHLEGQLSRYNPNTDDWEPTTREAPFGLDDRLYALADTQVEVIMPNNTWLRMDGDTRLQLVSLEPDTTDLDVAFGKARLYNKSDKTQIKATTPFGHISAPPGSTFDISVTDKGVEIISIQKKVFFFHNTSSDKHEIRSNSSSVYADIDGVSAVPGEVDYAWKKWNQEMDSQWEARLRKNSESAAHLPEELHTDAYPLDENGVWERVYYDGAHHRFWRPIHVSAGWAPFTSGAWTVWHGDHVWIPHEPFGYVTHHYGNWLFTSGFWYWAPPVTRVMIHAHRPHLGIGFGWYPGRVAWIHHGDHLGWIPLGPREPYYAHRHWGRRSIVVSKGTRYRHGFHKYKHHKHAVVIHRSHLYRFGNYKGARIKSIPQTTIRENFRTTPVLKVNRARDHRHLRKAENRFRPPHRDHPSRQFVKPPSPRERRRPNLEIPHQKSPGHRDKVTPGGRKIVAQPGPHPPKQRPPKQRPPEHRSPEQRPPEHRSPKQRPPKQRPPEQRPPEQRSPEQRPPEHRSPKQRPPEHRSPEQRSPKQRPPEHRSPKQRPPEQRSPKQRPPEQRSPKQRPPEQRSVDRKQMRTTNRPPNPSNINKKTPPPRRPGAKVAPQRSPKDKSQSTQKIRPNRNRKNIEKKPGRKHRRDGHLTPSKSIKKKPRPGRKSDRRNEKQVNHIKGQTRQSGYQPRGRTNSRTRHHPSDSGGGRHRNR